MDQSRAVMRFSTIIDIGSASFKYGMRRLTEILAFPKAWYRRRTNAYKEQCKTSEARKSPAVGFYTKDNLKLDFEGQSTSTQHMISHGQSIGPARKLKTLGKSSSGDSSNTPPSEKNQITAWKPWYCSQLTLPNCIIRLWVFIEVVSFSSDAKGGIVGDSFEVSKINTRFHIKEESGIEPYHTMGLSFMALELKLDYMGTSVLMTRVISFPVSMKDKWNTSLLKNESGTQQGHNIHSWGFIMVSADLLKMYYKLEEFFTQQFMSSKRVFSSLEPRLHERNACTKRRQHMRKKSTGYGSTLYDLPDCEYKDDVIKLLNALASILAIVKYFQNKIKEWLAEQGLSSPTQDQFWILTHSAIRCSRTRSAIRCSRTHSAIRCSVYTESMVHRQLYYISFGSQVASFLVSIALPQVKQSD
uniref:FSA_C domain-containing protein n=1 Tax=Glossina brevipalpis TaxID=37001 RepID=A0A1A9WZJ0_9MUSC